MEKGYLFGALSSSRGIRGSAIFVFTLKAFPSQQEAQELTYSDVCQRLPRASSIKQRIGTPQSLNS